MEPDNRIILPARVRSRFCRALQSYDRHAVAQQQITAKAARLLRDHLRPLRNCLEIGCGTGDFTRHLQQLLPHANWTLNDLCAESLPLAARYCPHPPALLAGDAEQVELGSGYDLIASTSAFQWFAQPERFISRLAGMQKAGELLLFTTFSPGNLGEVATVTGKGLTYPTANEWREWLIPHYRLLLCEEGEIELRFASPLDVLRHLKYTGVTATHTGAWTRGEQDRFIRHYAHLFSTPHHQVTLTYRPLYLLAERT